VNRTGYEQEGAGAGLEFWGASFVSDPFGVVLERAGHGDEGVVVVECQRSRTEDVRRNWPFLRDRRIDAYGGLTRRLLD
jgi:N-carbamoylputrescine amidase